MSRPKSLHYNARHMLRCIFIVKCGIARFLCFSVLCVYSKFRYLYHPLGYLCAKFCFFHDPHCWASRKSHTQSIHCSITHPAYLILREPKLSLWNNLWQCTSITAECKSTLCWFSYTVTAKQCTKQQTACTLSGYCHHSPHIMTVNRTALQQIGRIYTEFDSELLEQNMIHKTHQPSAKNQINPTDFWTLKSIILFSIKLVFISILICMHLTISISQYQ